MSSRGVPETDAERRWSSLLRVSTLERSMKAKTKGQKVANPEDSYRD